TYDCAVTGLQSHDPATIAITDPDLVAVKGDSMQIAAGIGDGEDSLDGTVARPQLGYGITDFIHDPDVAPVESEVDGQGAAGKGAENLAITGPKLSHRSVVPITDPDTGAIIDHANRTVTHAEGTEVKAVAGSQFGEIIGGTVRDPDVGPIKGNAFGARADVK